MTKVTVFDVTGKKKEDISLPKELFAELNLPILAQAIRVFENRNHNGLARTKTRGEVTASTRKIYRQKGTGGARHGAKSAPIFVGGGVAHGPTGNRVTLSMPTKMKKRALQVALSIKAKEGRFVIVEGLGKLEKSKQAQSLISAVTKDQNGRCVLALSEKNKGSFRAFRNLKDVTVLPYRNLNAYTVFLGGTLLVDTEAFDEVTPKKEIIKKENKKEVAVKATVVKKGKK
jgi:large subunit ribosomal protein L4